MGLLVFDDIHFATENAKEPLCTRVISDNDDGSTNYDVLRVYRFGDQSKAIDWTSPKRQAVGGNFPRPSDGTLNDLALSQVRFGRKGTLGSATPFISVATSYAALFKHGEPWVQNLLKKVPDLGVFDVPFSSVMRPGINSHATKAETEWLYFDGAQPITAYLLEWRANPYR
jgi:hypothetical protein